MKSFIDKLLKNKLAFIGFIIIILIAVSAILAPVLAPYNPNKMDLSNTLLPSGSSGHLLGTDNYGRDILSRIIYGSRISLIVAVSSIFIGGIIGSILGLLAGYYGGRIDAVIMRIMDALFAFPFVLLAIILMTVLGQGLVNLIIAISITNIPGFARIVRGEAMVIKRSEFIEATKSIGASDFRIIFRHVFPNSVASMTVYSTMSIAGAILSEASLSYLGLGIQPPTATWGNILKGGQEYITSNPEMAVYSGIAILITVLGFNLFGDGLRDVLDPKTNN
ncbi:MULTISPECIES: ABC transporter permease [Clostridium]|uniref:ABC transporter permease n=1 Tax=Clostridium TaxID=1485 RepID=UPI000825C2D4|nr:MULTISPECIES: ABC transporter permease [Clostridium]PJI09277.1 ABC transporter permease [Clostridium sp. CT7]